MNKNYTIREKFIMVALAVGAVLVGFHTLLYFYVKKNINELAEQYSAGVMHQINNTINKIFHDIGSIGYNLSLGSSVENYLLPSNDYELYVNHNYFKSNIDSVIFSNDYIEDIALYRSDSRILYHYYKENEDLNRLLNYNREYFETQIQIPSFQVLYDEEKSLTYIAYVQPINYLSRVTSRWNEQIGCLIVLLDNELINDVLAGYYMDAISGIYILDKDYEFIAGTDIEEKNDVTWPESLIIQDIQGTDWKIGYKPNKAAVMKRYDFFRYMILVMVMIVVILFFLLLQIYNQSIIQPISDLHQQIAYITSGGLKKRIQIKREDEIGSIASVINTMLDHQTEISYRMLSTQQQLYENELKAKENELKLLENQVNPHFILNTLQCICGIAVTYDVPMIAEITTSMSRIFDYSLRASETVTLQEEIDIVRKYLSIIDIRFGNIFHWEINIPEKYWNLKLPKMCLQPLVENAVYHGLEQKGSGYMSVTCEEHSEILNIRIRDDGLGIEKECLAYLKKILSDESLLQEASMKKKRIGLTNSCLRIKNLFGVDYGIWIDSRENEGTEIVVRIPARYDG